jgi:hypothetical protein
MAYLTDFTTNFGSYVPSTNIWDISQIAEVNVNSPEFKELMVNLYQNLNLMAQVLNTKDSAFYNDKEFQTGLNVFPLTGTSQLDLRPGFRLTVDTGALPGGVTLVPHGLTIGTTWKFLKILGAASDNIGFNYYPLPFASAAGATNIEIRVDATNIVITNNSGVTFTSSFVILEYIKI